VQLHAGVFEEVLEPVLDPQPVKTIESTADTRNGNLLVVILDDVIAAILCRAISISVMKTSGFFGNLF
jgi:hypothetical protein